MLPRWSVIPLALTLVGGIIVLGVLVEPLIQSIAAQPEPTPTPALLKYQAPQSWECLSCHISQDRLRQTVTDVAELERLWIDPADIFSTHGRLGCMTCHGGTGDTQDVAQAHQGLIPNPADYREAAKVCLQCHSNVRTDIPEKHIHTPHERILRGMREGWEVCACSNCHGPVAHGEKPIASHEGLAAYCIDCHQAKNVPPERLKCSGCHIAPHDITLDCEVCHRSTRTWSNVRLAVHPVELTGAHAQLACFDCHKKPNFRGLRYVCSDCHQRPHTFGDENCERCHTSEGWRK